MLEKRNCIHVQFTVYVYIYIYYKKGKLNEKYKFIIAADIINNTIITKYGKIQSCTNSIYCSIKIQKLEKETGASSWGIWRVDPGPRGVRLNNWNMLKNNNGVAPARWKFDANDWWLEEHGLIMEKPDFPLPSGRYVVTGGRETTSY